MNSLLMSGKLMNGAGWGIFIQKELQKSLSVIEVNLRTLLSFCNFDYCGT